MQKKLSTLALVVLVAIVAFACGTMVTDVEAQTSKRTYIGTFVSPNPTGNLSDRYWVAYEENGEIVGHRIVTFR